MIMDDMGKNREKETRKKRKKSRPPLKIKLKFQKYFSTLNCG
jgi:hypothetical protein